MVVESYKNVFRKKLNIINNGGMFIDKKLFYGTKRVGRRDEAIKIKTLAPTDQQNVIHRLHIVFISQPVDKASSHLDVR